MRIRLILPVVLLTLLFNTVCYGLTGKQRVEIRAKTEIMGIVMEELLDNYMGKNLTVQELYETAMSGMMFELDEFSEYFPADNYELLLSSLAGDVMGIGIVAEKKKGGIIEIVEVFEGMNADKAGIRKGDIIQKINNKPVNQLEIEDLAEAFSDRETATLEILRNGTVMKFTVPISKIHIPTVKIENIDNLPVQKIQNDTSKASYLRITLFASDTDQEIKKAIEDLKAKGVDKVVIDLRGNPGGYLDVALNICKEFVPKGPVFTTKDSNNRVETYTSNLNKVPFSKVVILVDNQTASASELFASAMQDSKAATIVGSTTFGKGVVQALITLHTGDGLKYTNMEYFRRSGGKINKIGVKPDIAVNQPDYMTDYVIMSNDNTSENMPQFKSLLANLGYTVGKPDKTLDQETKTSLEDFQKLMKLNPTGVPDPETVIALNEESYRREFEPYDKALDTAVKELFKNS